VSLGCLAEIALRHMYNMFFDVWACARFGEKKKGESKSERDREKECVWERKCVCACVRERELERVWTRE